MAFERACSLDEIAADQALAVTLGAYDVAIARHGDGDDVEVFAVEDMCSHAAVALSEGEVTDCTVECWLHGSRFDLRTGKPTGLPATEPVATFPTEIRAASDGTRDVYVDTDTTLNGVTPQ
jgi:3-phenylpropionate/trans-cinnamate dioxygenase ferredoxin subunit